MKTAAASVMSASASAPPIWNRIRKTSAFLRKLSLNAEKNWVQNRGAKRRVINSDEDIVFPPAPKRARGAPLTPFTSWQHYCALSPQAGRGHVSADSQLKRRQFGQDDSRLNRRGKAGLQKNNAGGPGPPAAQVPPCSISATSAGVDVLRVPSSRLPRSGRPPLHTRA